MEREARIESWASTILVYLSALTAFLKDQSTGTFQRRHSLRPFLEPHPSRATRRAVDRFGQPTDEAGHHLFRQRQPSWMSSSMSSFVNTKRSRVISAYPWPFPATARKWSKPHGRLALRNKSEEREQFVFSFVNEMDRESLHSQWEDRAKGEKRSRSRLLSIRSRRRKWPPNLPKFRRPSEQALSFVASSKTASQSGPEFRGNRNRCLTHHLRSKHFCSLRQVLHPTIPSISSESVSTCPPPRGHSIFPVPIPWSNPWHHIFSMPLLTKSFRKKEGLAVVAESYLPLHSRTYLLLLRHRFHLKVTKAEERIFLSEEIRAVAYQGSHNLHGFRRKWWTICCPPLLRKCRPRLIKDTISEFVGQIHHVLPDLETQAKDRAEALLDSIAGT